MNKKILIDARLYGLENTGLGRYIMNLVQELIRIDRKHKYILLLRRKYFNSLNLPNNWESVLADFRHYSIREQVELPFLLSSLKPDLVHFPHLNVPILIKGRFIVTIHDLIMQRQGRRATTLPLPIYYAKRIPFKITARKAAVNSQAIVVPSHAVENEVINYYKVNKNKVFVIYEGLDKNLKYRISRNDVLKKYGINGKYFIYVGNVYPHKNIKRLIQAVKTINEISKEKVKIVIVSARNTFLQRIEKFIEEIKADPYVLPLGFIPDDDLSALYNRSVAFVYPSVSEGFGLQGLEAISAKTLVLASDIPVFREVYGNSVFYFDPFNTDSLVKTMVEVLKMKIKERNIFINESQKFIKKYSWRKTAKETLDLYIKLLEAR